MGQDVKTHTDPPLTETRVAASVRTFLGAWRSEERVVSVVDRRSRGDPRETPEDITAAVFSAWEREPSFYLGLSGPSLRSALQGGIAYPWGHRPEGRDQKFNGCSPL